MCGAALTRLTIASDGMTLLSTTPIVPRSQNRNLKHKTSPSLILRTSCFAATRARQFVGRFLECSQW